MRPGPALAGALVALVAVNGLITAPVSKKAAGLAQDDRERSTIPYVHHWIEHQLGAAGGDAGITVSISPAGTEANRLRQAVVNISAIVFIESTYVGTGQEGLF